MMETLKNIANDHFRKAHYAQAIEFYTKAIDEDPDSKAVAACYANRSFATCRLEQYGQAVLDASKAIEIDPHYIKAYYRRAAARMALKNPKAALQDFKQVAELQKELNQTTDKFIYAKIKECEKLIHRLAFEKAIAVDTRKDKPLAYTTDCDAIVVESSYDGPRLKDEKIVTEEFVSNLISHFKNEKILHRKYAMQILCQSYKIFAKQPSLIEIEVPYEENFIVVGDVHGQYYDLINIIQEVGLPSEKNRYLFNGDIVDRGSFSIECILLLLSYKILYPKHLFIARGNHETNSMNQMYGFEGECKHKYSSMMFDFFSQIFQVLPLAHLLIGLDENSHPANKVLVMHGGLFSSDDVTLEDIKGIDRDRQPPNEGPMCEILWSDPMFPKGRHVSKRGIAIAFGPDVTEAFCRNNGLQYIIRSHEVKQEGYEVEHDGKCITIFSAPNYCDSMGNLGATLHVKAPTLQPEFRQHKAVEHPEVRPMAYANQLMSQML